MFGVGGSKIADAVASESEYATSLMSGKVYMYSTTLDQH